MVSLYGLFMILLILYDFIDIQTHSDSLFYLVTLNRVEVFIIIYQLFKFSPFRLYVVILFISLCFDYKIFSMDYIFIWAFKFSFCFLLKF